MKTKKILLTGILGMALAGVLLTGCKKDATNPTGSTDSDITSAEDDGNANSVSTDGQSVSNAAMQTNVGHRATSGPITLSNYGNAVVKLGADSGAVGTYDTLYIIFPNTPTYCLDGKYRSGEILVYWPKVAGSFLWQAYFDSASVITEQFKNYAVGSTSNNMNSISGTRIWTNEGQNQGGYQNWKFTANLTLTYANGGGTATWNSIRTNVLTNVGGTWYYSITGTVEGVNRKNVDYSITITSPLYVTAAPWWAGGCAWIEAGTININRAGNNNTLTVNFGNIGTCDDQAVATINGVNYTFYMW